MSLATERVGAGIPKRPGAIRDRQEGTTMTQNETNSGKGLSRIEIARRAFERTDKANQAARRRLDAAMAAEEARETKTKTKGQTQLEKALALVRAAGIQVDDSDLGTDAAGVA